MAPDHHAYAYLVSTSTGSISTGLRYGFTLHVHDIASGTDRSILTWPATADSMSWAAGGIRVLTGAEFVGGTLQELLVRPSDGAMLQTRPVQFSTEDPVMGYDSSGRAIVREGGFDMGTAYTFYLRAKDGARVVIYSGRHGDPAGFEPGPFVSDGDPLWTSSLDGTTIWLWTDRGGLQRFAVRTAQPATAWPVRAPEYYVAGPCS